MVTLKAQKKKQLAQSIEQHELDDIDTGKFAISNVSDLYIRFTVLRGLPIHYYQLWLKSRF